MLKIWGRNNSVNVEKVLWACEEMGIDYERVDAGGKFGVVDTPCHVTRPRASLHCQGACTATSVAPSWRIIRTRPWTACGTGRVFLVIDFT